MRRALAMLCVCAALLAADRPLSSSAADTATPEDAAPSDVQDLLLLSPLQPIRLRLRIQVAGVPLRTAWRNAFDELFAEFDDDRDGHLTRTQEQQFMACLPAGNQTAQTRLDSVIVGSRAVTREELLRRAEQLVPPLMLRQQLSSRGAGPALIPLLDRDGDGRLSRAELQSAPESLHCRDFNDDQLISEGELLARPSVAQHDAEGNLTPLEGPLLLLDPRIDAPRLAEILLARYDRDRNGQLSCTDPAEVVFADELLPLLDENRDQVLSRTELQRFLTALPAIEIPFVLGRGGQAPARENRPSGYALRRKLDGGYRLTLGAVEVDFRRNNRDPAREDDQFRFENFDANTDGFLDESELANVPFLPGAIQADADRDGKVSPQELQAYVRRRNVLAAAQVSLNVTDQGYDLFSTLDVNSDGVLTPRELRFAPRVLETADRGGDGYLGSDDVSYHLLFEIVRGGPRVSANAVVARRGGGEPRVKAELKGPAWFRKMDRNDDGDVTLQEFLGDRPTFQRLDTDGDGLLSPDEAAQAVP